LGKYKGVTSPAPKSVLTINSATDRKMLIVPVHFIFPGVGMMTELMKNQLRTLP
jgi:hypothetical protein